MGPRDDLTRRAVVTGSAGLAAGLLLGSGSSLVNELLRPSSSLAVLDWATAAAGTAVVLFGWPGLAGFVLGRFVGSVLGGSSPERVLAVAVISTIPGVVAWLVLTRARGVSRALPDLRSYLALTLSAVLGSLATGLLGSAYLFRSMLLQGAMIWGAGALVGFLLLVLPALIGGSALLASWLVRLPDDTPPARPAGPISPVGAPAEPESRWHRPSHLILVGLLLIGTITAVVVLLSGRLPFGERWLNLLYMIPILWAANRDGLRGGVLSSSGVGLLFLAGRSFIDTGSSHPGMHTETLGVFPVLLLFCLTGAILGAARDRERRLTADLAASNRLLREDLQRAVRALTGAIEAKDAYTEGHVNRVTEFAVEVGGRLGLDGRDMQLLRWASALHDVGKIGISEAILTKKGPLTAEERALIERHPEIGARILRTIEGMEDAARLVLHHQERFDGRRDGRYPGYPAGLAGDAIPLGSRIIAVVDAFDAMTSDRPYRGRFPLEEAVAELRRERGLQFDPQVVDSFLEVLAERSWE